jgi:Cdc6-like AAA superfamily ATPase
LRLSEFVASANGSTSIRTLYCPGIPGAGKTLLSALVVQALRKLFPGNDTAVAFRYCN